MNATKWNKLTSEERYNTLRTIYPDCWMVNHMSISKWNQIPEAARNLIKAVL